MKAMTEKPENLVLELLQVLRADNAGIKADIAALRDEMNHKFGSVSQTLVSMQREMHGIKREVAGLTARFETLNFAIDEHTHRLDRIETRLGMADA
jgi:uncharacterized protein YoxC